MARYFTDFTDIPTGELSASGQQDWKFKINGGTTLFENFVHSSGARMLRLRADATNATRVIGYSPLDGVADNIETLTLFNVIPYSGDGSAGRFGVNYIRYSGTSEATTKGYAASFLPVSNVKNVVLQEDSVGVVQYTPFEWTINTWYCMRTRISGNDRYVKVWPNSVAEPAAWTFQSTGTPPAMTNIYSGLGTYAANHVVYVAQFSAGTDGDAAPINAGKAMPSSTPIVGFSGGYGGPFSSYGAAIGLAQQNTVLEIQDASHQHIATSITATQSHKLTAANAAHTHTATSPTLTQVHTLTVANASHDLTSSSLVIAITHNLVIQNASHGLTSDSISLVTGYAAVADNTVHNLTSENITLQQHQTLVIDSTTHLHVATSPTIVESKTLVVSNAIHALTDSIGNLNVTHYLAIDNTVHNLSSSVPLPVQAAILAIQNATHNLTSTSVDIIQFTLLNKPDDAVHHLTSSVPVISQEHTLEIENALHRLRSDIIVKIINWTEMGVDFGIYIPGSKKSGTFDEEEISQGTIIPAKSNNGTFESVEINSGNYIPNNIQKGNF